MVYSKTLKRVMDEILKVQKADFDKDITDNFGVSIDAMALIHKLVTHKRYTGNAVAIELAKEIEQIDTADILKYAKTLTKNAQNSAYHIVRKTVLA